MGGASLEWEQLERVILELSKSLREACPQVLEFFSHGRHHMVHKLSYRVANHMQFSHNLHCAALRVQLPGEDGSWEGRQEQTSLSFPLSWPQPRVLALCTTRTQWPPSYGLRPGLDFERSRKLRLWSRKALSLEKGARHQHPEP